MIRKTLVIVALSSISSCTDKTKIDKEVMLDTLRYATHRIYVAPVEFRTTKSLILAAETRALIGPPDLTGYPTNTFTALFRKAIQDKILLDTEPNRDYRLMNVAERSNADLVFSYVITKYVVVPFSYAPTGAPDGQRLILDARFDMVSTVSNRSVFGAETNYSYSHKFTSYSPPARSMTTVEDDVIAAASKEAVAYAFTGFRQSFVRPGEEDTAGRERGIIYQTKERTNR